MRCWSAFCLLPRAPAHLDEDNVSRYQIASLDFVLLAISNNRCLECDVRLEFGDNVSSSLLLVPSDEGVLG